MVIYIRLDKNIGRPSAETVAYRPDVSGLQSVMETGRPGLEVTLMSIAQAARVIALTALVMLAVPVFGEQSYVTRYDVYTGYSYFNSPKVSLTEHGFHLQAGFRPKLWYSVGFDYSIANGNLTLTPDLLPTALQQQLGAQLAQLAALGRLPAGYKLAVGSNSTTQTFETGPQLAYRHFQHVTLFIRPALGAMREVATPTPADPIAKAIVAQLAPEREEDGTGRTSTDSAVVRTSCSPTILVCACRRTWFAITCSTTLLRTPAARCGSPSGRASTSDGISSSKERQASCSLTPRCRLDEKTRHDLPKAVLSLTNRPERF